MIDNFQGFSLFNDVDDLTLRTRNRAVVLANIFQDNSEGAKMNLKGGYVFLSYFKLIQDDEKADVEQEFRRQMKERGFKE